MVAEEASSRPESNVDSLRKTAGMDDNDDVIPPVRGLKLDMQPRPVSKQGSTKKARTSSRVSFATTSDDVDDDDDGRLVMTRLDTLRQTSVNTAGSLPHSTRQNRVGYFSGIRFSFCIFYRAPLA